MCFCTNYAQLQTDAQQRIFMKTMPPTSGMYEDENFCSYASKLQHTFGSLDSNR